MQIRSKVQYPNLWEVAAYHRRGHNEQIKKGSYNVVFPYRQGNGTIHRDFQVKIEYQDQQETNMEMLKELHGQLMM